MGAQVQSQRFGVYLQPAQLRANLEFGVDPAIEADGARHASFDRRRVSLRWLSGTLLTGLFGAALIGSAIYAALGHQTYFAEAPAPSLSQRKEINLDFGVNPHKGDRLVKAVDIVQHPQMRENLGKIGLDVVADPPDVFADIIRSDTAKWAKVIKDAGIKAGE